MILGYGQIWNLEDATKQAMNLIHITLTRRQSLVQLHPQEALHIVKFDKS